MPIDTTALRAGLDAERQELLQEIESSVRELDESDDDRLRAAIELRRSQLRKVERALHRHADGSWDRCESCDGAITEDQIKVLPTVTHCTDCAGDELYWGDTKVISLDELGLS